MSKPSNDYVCHGPFIHGAAKQLCVHAWNVSHCLSSEEAQYSDKLTNAGLLPARQQIDKLEEKKTG